MSLLFSVIHVLPNNAFALRRKDDKKHCLVAFRRSVDADRAAAYLRRHLRHSKQLPALSDDGPKPNVVKVVVPPRGVAGATTRKPLEHNVCTLDTSFDELLHFASVHYFDVYVSERVSFTQDGDILWLDVYEGGRKLSVVDPSLVEFMQVDR